LAHDLFEKIVARGEAKEDQAQAAWQHCKG
jgi:hypothetical protein